jgi:hypothetical protein
MYPFSFCSLHDKYDCGSCQWAAEQARIRASNAAYYAREDDQRMREGGGDD